MKKPQWIVTGIALLLTFGLYALTQKQIFGYNPKKPVSKNSSPATTITADTILHHAKENLTAEQLARISVLENRVSSGNAPQIKHLYHKLARFWADTARVFEPYAWYIAEEARLESSEKSLTFAAHLFLNSIRGEENLDLKKWKGLQAKDLFERSLKINPANDSAQVGLGATYLYGNFSPNPMEGILKIRQVAERDTTNVYAQMSLGQASIVSGQPDKAIERFIKVVQLQPHNLEAILSLADVYERKGSKKEAILWYKKSLPLINIAGLKKEVELRIAELSK